MGASFTQGTSQRIAVPDQGVEASIPRLIRWRPVDGNAVPLWKPVRLSRRGSDRSEFNHAIRSHAISLKVHTVRRGPLV
jgi:hypothetical protein